MIDDASYSSEKALVLWCFGFTLVVEDALSSRGCKSFMKVVQQEIRDLSFSEYKRDYPHFFFHLIWLLSGNSTKESRVVVCFRLDSNVSFLGSVETG